MDGRRRRQAIIPLLSPDVFTLAEYGDDPAIIHASDRDEFLHVLGFPRGETSGKLYDDGTWTSVVVTRITPVEVCQVSLDGASLPEDAWSFDQTTAILDVTYTTTSGELLVTGC
jgi:hypothetical protein